MARDDMYVVVRDKVDLFREKGPHYKTIIDNILDNGELIAPVPSRMGVQMIMSVGDQMFIAFFRDSGRYVAPVRVAGFVEEGKLRFVRLKQIEKPEREQRRGFYRLPASLKVLVCPYPEEDREYFPNAKDTWDDNILETARTVNISVTGIAVKTKMEMLAGERYLLKVFLNWPKETSPPYIICGEVKRVFYEPDRELYQSGLHYIDHNDAMGEYIAKYILLQQQKMIQRKRFVEGD